MASVGGGTARYEAKSFSITGGRRVGSDLARMLADRGANVAMTYRSSRAVIEHTIADVQSRGVEGMAARADLSDPTRPPMRWLKSSRGSAASTHWSTWPAFTGERRWPLWPHATSTR